jgi:hypothetical protein
VLHLQEQQQCLPEPARQQALSPDPLLLLLLRHHCLLLPQMLVLLLPVLLGVLSSSL